MTAENAQRAPQAPAIRTAPFPPGGDHSAGAWRLSQQAGWPHRPRTWALTLSVSNGVVALQGGTVVGTALATIFGYSRDAQHDHRRRKAARAGPRSATDERGCGLRRHTRDATCRHRGGDTALPQDGLCRDRRNLSISRDSESQSGAGCVHLGGRCGQRWRGWRRWMRRLRGLLARRFSRRSPRAVRCWLAPRASPCCAPSGGAMFWVRSWRETPPRHAP